MQRTRMAGLGLCEWRQIKTQIYSTRAQAKTDIFDYNEGFYNRTRRHKHLDQLSPHEFKRQRQTSP
jgi:putative transposase